MKKYKSKFYESKSTVIESFKNYFLDQDRFKDRMKSEVKIFLNKGIILTDSQVKYIPIGKSNDCEENSYKYAKKNNMQVVQGYAQNEDYWINHFWVYDNIKNLHIEVTPGFDDSIGRIGRIIKKELLKTPLSKWGNLKQTDYEKI